MSPFAPVVLLFSWGGPSTIFGRIWTVIVDTVKSESGRARPHVGIEVFETVKPAITDQNATSAVSGVSDMLWFQATGFHALPATVAGDLQEPVFDVRLAGSFAHQASAGLSSATPQIVTIDNAVFSAGANDMPSRKATAIRSALQNGQSSEHLAREIDKIGVSHNSQAHAHEQLDASNLPIIHNPSSNGRPLSFLSCLLRR
jgi:hypothetical protein